MELEQVPEVVMTPTGGLQDAVWDEPGSPREIGVDEGMETTKPVEAGVAERAQE
jgi:hypothetical protein